MSYKLCSRCGGQIVFGHLEDTDQVIPLMVGSRVYRKVKDNIVRLDSEAFVPHVCASGAMARPSPEAVERHFSEPKEIE